MSAEATGRAALHVALGAMMLEAEANGGRLDKEGFWEFVAMVAQGRGIAEDLHAAGLAALQAVRGQTQDPKGSMLQRQERAYHLGLLAQLLMDAGRVPGQASVLPANFQHGVVVHDLMGMLAGPDKMGEGAPLILTSDRKGLTGMRREARGRLVGVVRWRMGRTGTTRDKVWFELMGNDASTATLDGWQEDVGGGKGPLCVGAFEAGRRGDLDTPLAASNSDLSRIIALATSGPGRRRKT